MSSVLENTNETCAVGHEELKQSLHDSLSGWWRSSQPEIARAADDELFYGTAYDAWGVQTQQKALSVAAYLAVHGDALAKEQFVDLLRYNLRTHKSSAQAGNDGVQWGHTWISVLGVERMMFALEDAMAAGLIPAAELHDLRRVLVSEADWILQEYPIVAGLVDNNKPESNIWNGAILHRVALMYPDTEHAAAYRAKGDLFLLNGISIESDLESDAVVGSNIVKEAVVGANFYESMALNHHHYLNVGYMVICLSNIAMLHFSFKRQGQEAPAALYHNVEKLWDLIKTLTFDDGRLWRIGGDTRARYCYCQDYALPMWAFVQDYIGEDCTSLIDGWCEQVFKEQVHNKATLHNELYLSERLSEMNEQSPLYFTRLDSDRACSLAMTAAWMPLYTTADLKPAATPRMESWYDEYHAAYAVRGDHRCASWVWDAGEGPTGTCVPPQASDMAEWGCNAFPLIRGMGDRSGYTLIEQDGQCFGEGKESGFATIGKVQVRDFGVVAEGGNQGYALADVQCLAIALPNEKSCIYLQYAETTGSHYFREVQGVHVKIPNDLWNGFKRDVVTSKGSHDLNGADGIDEIIDTQSGSLAVDNKLQVQSLYQYSDLDRDQSLQIKRQAVRGTGLRHLGHAQVQRVGGCLFTEDICAPVFAPKTRQRIADKTCLLNGAFSLSCEAHDSIRLISYERIADAAGVMKLSDGVRVYVIAVNFSNSVQQCVLTSELKVLAESKSSLAKNRVTLAPVGFVCGISAD